MTGNSRGYGGREKLRITKEEREVFGGEGVLLGKRGRMRSLRAFRIRAQKNCPNVGARVLVRTVAIREEGRGDGGGWGRVCGGDAIRLCDRLVEVLIVQCSTLAPPYSHSIWVGAGRATTRHTHHTPVSTPTSVTSSLVLPRLQRPYGNTPLLSLPASSASHSVNTLGYCTTSNLIQIT
jgi:hypothetical protein